MTIKKIIELAEKTRPGSKRGNVILEPAVQLVHSPTGAIVHVRAVGEAGEKRDMVLVNEFPSWRPVGEFSKET